MKTLFKFLFVGLLVLPLAVAAQKGGTPPQKGGSQEKGSQGQGGGGDCFKEWYNLFRERGAATVTDGTQDVIISLRNTVAGVSQCYMGRVEVAGGKIKRPIMIQKVDGSYEPFATLGKGLDPGFIKSMTEDEMNTIADGMSVNFLMAGGEFGRIFFYTFLNEKPKALKQAPSARTLIKN